MMNYEMFKEIVSEKLADYLPDEYKDRKLSFGVFDKINTKRDGVTFMVTEDDPRVSPTMYLDGLYEDYKKIGDIELVLHGAAQDLCKHLEIGKEMVEKIHVDEIRDNVFFSVINAEQNQEYLQNRPHRNFNDLAIVYDYLVEINETGIVSVPITNDLARLAGLEEQELFALSEENTKRLLPTVIKPMSHVIAELMDMDTVPFELRQAIEQEMEVNEPMFVITNASKHRGAGAMLYEEGLHELSTFLNNDLYLLPSSIHELIAVSVDTMTPLELADMVQEINQMEVEIGDRLSNQVYHYDRTTRKVTMATDTPNKSLDNHRDYQEFEVTRTTVR